MLVDLQHVWQTVENWDVEYIDEIYTVDENQSCKQLFHRAWLGNEKATAQYDCGDDVCSEIYPGFPMVQQDVFYKKRICAKHLDGVNYLY